MPAKPSRDMLTTGLVGSFLLAASWALILLGVLIILLQGAAGSMESSWGGPLAGFGAISGLLWLGGMICEGIGWVGLGRLYPGLPTFLGWFEGALPVSSLLALLVVVVTWGGGVGIVHLLVILQLTYFFLAFLWMLTHGPRAQTLAATLGYGLGFLSGATLYALVATGTLAETVIMLIMVVLPAGATIGHLATGNLFGKSRELADSVNTF